MKTLFDYHEAAEFMDLSPGYVKRLCGLRKLGYVVKEYRRGCGRYRRLKRYTPQGEIARYMFRRTARRFIPVFERHLMRSAAIEEDGDIGGPAGSAGESGRESVMKCYHDFALVLVSWYLILPPVLPNGSPNTKLPLSQWEQSGAFDRATDCNQARMELLQRAGRQLARVRQQLEPEAQTDPNRPLSEMPGLGEAAARAATFALRVNSAQCISTDDPRLKEK